MDSKHYHDTEMQRYFDSLPKIIQESIIQSGAQLSTLSELESFVNSITKNK